MKKLLSTLVMLFAAVFSLNAQQSKVELSAYFDEPDDGWNKIMQLKSGNTLYFHFAKKEGIEVTVYDKAHKRISARQLTSDMWDQDKMKRSQIKGMYEINGKPVIFLEQLIDRTPTLFRIIINPQTGGTEKQMKIGELQHYGAGAGYAMAFGNVDPNEAYVEKDPASDCYAVVYFNGFAHETDTRIQVVHYDGNHTELNRAYYTLPNSDFKYLEFVGMTVNADKQVFLCTYGYNTGGDADSRIIVSRLRKGEKTFTHNQLEFSEDFEETKALMQYNPESKLLQLYSLTYVKSKHKLFSDKTTSLFLPLMSYIDPESLTIVGMKPIQAKKTSEYLVSRLDREDGYSGIPQQMIINSDHTTTLLMEELSVIQREHHSTETNLGNIGILELSDTGAELQGYGILKSQMAYGEIPTMYLAAKGKGYWSYKRGGMHLDNNQFLSYDYVNTDKGRYILFNDYPDNFDKDEKKKRKTVTTISSANTICYRLNNGDMSKYYLFGEPKDDDESRFCYIESSHFLKETNTYATLVVERKGRDKQARIAWLTFE